MDSKKQILLKYDSATLIWSAESTNRKDALRKAALALIDGSEDTTKVHDTVLIEVKNVAEDSVRVIIWGANKT